MRVSGVRTGRAALVAVAAGACVGIASQLVVRLPSPIGLLRTLGGPWLATAFAVGSVVRSRRSAWWTGALSMAAAVNAYYVYFTPWEKNPNLCRRGFTGLHATLCPSMRDSDVHGAEVDVSMLFADIRGSSELARRVPTMEFTHLMNRFYGVAREVLVDHDAIIEKFVGDGVVGLFLPFLAGSAHAARAVEAARALLEATGHRSTDGPWVPLGVGLHTGAAFVGVVGSKDALDFSALGDRVNIAAHLAGKAAAGEILLTGDVATRGGHPIHDLERRAVSLKGFEIEAVVLRS